MKRYDKIVPLSSKTAEVISGVNDAMEEIIYTLMRSTMFTSNPKATAFSIRIHPADYPVVMSACHAARGESGESPIIYYNLAKIDRCLLIDKGMAIVTTGIEGESIF